MSQTESVPSSRDREWTKQVARECTPVEIAQCMGDLLDRAEFAEEMARRHIVERLAAAMRRWEENMGWSGVEYAEVKRVLDELETLRAA